MLDKLVMDAQIIKVLLLDWIFSVLRWGGLGCPNFYFLFIETGLVLAAVFPVVWHA